MEELILLVRILLLPGSSVTDSNSKESTPSDFSLRPLHVNFSMDEMGWVPLMAISCHHFFSAVPVFFSRKSFSPFPVTSSTFWRLARTKFSALFIRLFILCNNGVFHRWYLLRPHLWLFIGIFFLIFPWALACSNSLSSVHQIAYWRLGQVLCMFTHYFCLIWFGGGGAAIYQVGSAAGVNHARNPPLNLKCTPEGINSECKVFLPCLHWPAVVLFYLLLRTPPARVSRFFSGVLTSFGANRTKPTGRDSLLLPANTTPVRFLYYRCFISATGCLADFCWIWDSRIYLLSCCHSRLLGVFRFAFLQSVEVIAAACPCHFSPPCSKSRDLSFKTYVHVFAAHTPNKVKLWCSMTCNALSRMQLARVGTGEGGKDRTW